MPMPTGTGELAASGTRRTKPASTKPMKARNSPIPTLMACLRGSGTASNTAWRNPVSTRTVITSPSITTITHGRRPRHLRRQLERHHPVEPEPGGQGERVAADDAHEDGHHRRHQGGGAGHLGEVEAGAVDVGRAAQDDRVEDHDVGHREEGGQRRPAARSGRWSPARGCRSTGRSGSPSRFRQGPRPRAVSYAQSRSAPSGYRAVNLRPRRARGRNRLDRSDDQGA